MKAAEKHELRREELFAMITNLISQEGYENITIRGICKKLEISTGAFYHYFNDKSDLIRVLFDDIDNYFVTVVPEQFTEDEGHNLICFFEGYGKYTKKNGVETCKCISAAPFKKNSESYMEPSRGITQTLHGIIERGIEKKQFRSNRTVDELTEMIMIMMRGYTADWGKKNGEYDITKELINAAEFLEISLKHAPEA